MCEVQVGEIPLEENVWLTASNFRDAAEIVQRFPSTRTNLQRVSAGQTALLDLAVTLQMLPGSMTDQAVQQQLLQLGPRRLQEALRSWFHQTSVVPRSMTGPGLRGSRHVVV